MRGIVVPLDAGLMGRGPISQGAVCSLDREGQMCIFSMCLVMSEGLPLEINGEKSQLWELAGAQRPGGTPPRQRGWPGQPSPLEMGSKWVPEGITFRWELRDQAY